MKTSVIVQNPVLLEPRVPLIGNPYRMTDGAFTKDIFIRVSGEGLNPADYPARSIHCVSLTTGRNMHTSPERFCAIELLRPAGHELKFEVMR